MATQDGGQGHRAQQGAAQSASQTPSASQPAVADCEVLSTEAVMLNLGLQPERTAGAETFPS